jgi:ribonucleotide monophosphatase NagD (HAD superfamily)
VLQVFSSLRAAKKVIEDQQLRPLLLLHPDALPEFSSINCAEPNAVVLGLAKEAFSYDSMNAAFRLLMQQPQAPLIAIHKAKYYTAADGQLALGPGPYAAALEFATGRTAQVRCQTTSAKWHQPQQHVMLLMAKILWYAKFTQHHASHSCKLR